DLGRARGGRGAGRPRSPGPPWLETGGRGAVPAAAAGRDRSRTAHVASEPQPSPTAPADGTSPAAALACACRGEGSAARGRCTAAASDMPATSPTTNETIPAPPADSETRAGPGQ